MEDQMASAPPTIKRLMKKIKASPIASFFICMAWLQHGLILIGASLQSITAEVEPIYELKSARLGAFQDNHTHRAFVQNQLGSLLDLPLERGPLFESHRDCLVRAANIAHRHYLGGHYYDFAEVLNQTVEWAQDNCDRLAFTPPIRYDQSGLFNKAIAALSGKAVCMYERVKIVGLNAWNRFSRFRPTRIRNTEKRTDVRTPSQETTTSSKKDHSVLPPRINLDCSGPICHLSGNSSSLRAVISEDEIRIARKSVLKYEFILAVVSTAQCIVGFIEHLTFTALLIPYPLLTVSLAILTFTEHTPPITIHNIRQRLQGLRQEHSSAPLPHRYRLLILLILFGARSTRSSLLRCLIEPCFVLGLTLLLVFFFHASANPPASLAKLVQTLHEIDHIWRLDSLLLSAPRNTKPDTAISLTTGAITHDELFGLATSEPSIQDTIREIEKLLKESHPSSSSSATGTAADKKRRRVTAASKSTTMRDDLDDMVRRCRRTREPPA